MTRREQVEQAAKRCADARKTPRERRAGRVPQDWIRAARQGRSPQWIARELVGDETQWKDVHRALFACEAYRT